jgi:hypothetical protein
MDDFDPIIETGDPDTVADLEAAKDLIIAAQTFTRHLTAEEIDAILGLR